MSRRAALATGAGLCAGFAGRVSTGATSPDSVGSELVENDDTDRIFENPESQRVEDSITGRFG